MDTIYIYANAHTVMLHFLYVITRGVDVFLTSLLPAISKLLLIQVSYHVVTL